MQNNRKLCNKVKKIFLKIYVKQKAAKRQICTLKYISRICCALITYTFAVYTCISMCK